MLEVGDKAPDFNLCSVEGDPVSLAETLATGQHVLLVFLRHLG